MLQSRSSGRRPATAPRHHGRARRRRQQTCQSSSASRSWHSRACSEICPPCLVGNGSGAAMGGERQIAERWVGFLCLMRFTQCAEREQDISYIIVLSLFLYFSIVHTRQFPYTFQLSKEGRVPYTFQLGIVGRFSYTFPLGIVSRFPYTFPLGIVGRFSYTFPLGIVGRFPHTFQPSMVRIGFLILFNLTQ